MSKTQTKGWTAAVVTIGFAVACFCGLQAIAQTQSAPASGTPKTAAQQFKNIQVLKDIPADQLIPSMQFIAASLGVDCEFCHVEHEMQKDDKKEKQVARKMIEMELAINKSSFKNEVEVTCYTCHRGAAHPVGVPILSADASKPAPHVHDAGAGANLPSPDQLLSKYLAAVGGTDALKKIKSRVQKGTLDTGDAHYPIEVYSEGPDKRVSISHTQNGDSVTAFNGETGWLKMRNGFHPMTKAEQEAARIDALLYLPLQVKELYKEFHVRPGDEIGGKKTYMVQAQSSDPNRPGLQLYFDPDTGLLLRQKRFAQTPLGSNPTQIDYSDYRTTDGVQIPYQWTLTRPGGSFTIKIDQAQQNVPIDEKLFVIPANTHAPH